MRSPKRAGLIRLVNTVESSHSALIRAQAFFESAYCNYLLSAANAGEKLRYYQLAQFTLCLKFAGEALASPLTAALEHLEIEAVENPDLTICIWDSISTQTPSFEIPWSPDSYALRGEVVGYHCEQIRIFVQTGILHVFHEKQNTALYWTRDHRNLPWWIAGSPLQILIHLWMQRKGLQLTHAAAVGYPEGGVLLTGKGGAGKSTTTLGCMELGMRYLSEDYCLLSSAPAPWIYSVYNSAKITDTTLSRFPNLGNRVQNSSRQEGDKALLFHQQFQPEKILLGCPLKAIIALQITDLQQSRLEPVNPVSIFASLSASTLWQLHYAGPSIVHHLKQVALSVPCYQLFLGYDWADAPKRIETLIKDSR